ncbi:5'-nucleotidase C-terminal domain-containing protein [Vibrio parahaemolyticus]|nr:5'-nucleotidase C-terminal domain-containing protein [Vibrio parahaemolyticus]
MKFSKSLLVVAVGAALAGCGSDSDNSPVTCETADSCTKFTVLHTNDNHGRFWENSKGEYGMAARKTLIDSIRAEVESSGGETILLSGGDINTGVPESDMQAHEWGKYVGRADFEYYDGKLHLANYALIPVNLKAKDANGDYQFIAEEIKPDAVVKQILRTYQEQGQDLLDVKVSSTDGKLEGDRGVVRSQQTNLGHLLGEAYRTYELVKADFGVMNSGGVRDSIQAGDITYRDVLTVQPFGNFVTKATMTGKEVKEYLDVVATKSAGSGAYAQLDNITLDVDCDAGSVTITDINGKGFNLDATYTFAVISFSAAGGDDYPVIQVESTQMTDASVLREFFVNNPQISADSYNKNLDNIKYFSNSQAVKGCPATGS